MHAGNQPKSSGRAAKAIFLAPLKFFPFLFICEGVERAYLCFCLSVEVEDNLFSTSIMWDLGNEQR